MSTEHSDDIVRLVTAPNPVDAHIWQQALDAEGIRCHVVGDYLDAGIGDIPGFKAEIWVHRDDLTPAQAIIDEGQLRMDATRDKGPATYVPAIGLLQHIASGAARHRSLQKIAGIAEGSWRTIDNLHRAL